MASSKIRAWVAARKPEKNRPKVQFRGTALFQQDPHWRDYILFYEYFHGENGAGLGASHQTGWTGLVARLIQVYGLVDAKRLLEAGVARHMSSAA